jgi:hypothetical protein
MQSVSITNYIVSSNLDQGEVYSIQYYVIKFVNGFLWVLQSPPPRSDDIAEILLKVALNTIKQTNKNIYLMFIIKQM